MNTPKQHILVFTDLDATLLDHDSYKHDPAKPVLERLKRHNIPLIPTTSKTIVEIEDLGIDFGTSPYIGENGMVIKVPQGYLLPPYDKAKAGALHKSRNEILEFVETLPARFQDFIENYNKMGLEWVMKQTGLNRDEATLSSNRLGSEPFIWTGDHEDDNIRELTDLAQQQGLAIARGGRFYHLMSAGGKHETMLWMRDRVQDKYPDHNIITIALGDGENDAGMLAAADYGVKIPNSALKKDFQIANPRGTIIHAPHEGPAGFNMALNAILDELEIGIP